MFAGSRNPVAVSGRKAASDGAELPLLDPRLLPTLIASAEQRRTRAGSAEFLILSEPDLGEFEPRRVRELRAALVGAFPAEYDRPVSNKERLRVLRQLTTRLFRRARTVAAYLSAAFALGLVAGLIG